MGQLLLDKFKDYVNIHYLDHNITTTAICYYLHCSRSHLHNIITHEYGYSIMRYVEYFRILKSIEHICRGERKVYLMVGYKSPSTFSRSFLRITGLNMRCFCPYQDINYKRIIKTVFNMETEDPKKAIENITKYVFNKIYTLKVQEESKKYKKSQKMYKKSQKKN